MRYLAIKDDPIAGGTTLDAITATPAAMLTPVVADAVPVESANTEAGERRLDRDADVRGRRTVGAPVSFAAAPTMTFRSKAWVALTRTLIRKAMGGAVTTTGVAPAAVASTVQMLQSGNLPALQAFLVREAQVDRMTGAWLDSITGNFPADAEGTIEATLKALYHDVDDIATIAPITGSMPDPQGMPENVNAYMLRDITAFEGAAATAIGCLGGFGFTLNNNLSDDFQTRFCAGKNVLSATVDSVLHKLWYPNRNKLGRQTVTCRLDYGDVRPDKELRRILAHADKLVVELNGPPITPATTPAANEMARLIFWKAMPTGGGADELASDGDLRSSYEFTAYLDEATGKDLEAVFTTKTAVA